MNYPDMPKIIDYVSQAYDALESNHEELGKWFGEHMKDNGYTGMNLDFRNRMLFTP